MSERRTEAEWVWGDSRVQGCYECFVNFHPEVHYIDSVLNSSPEVHYIVSVLNSSPEVHYIDSVLNSSPEVHYIDSVLNSSPEVHYIDSVLNSSPEVHYIDSVLNSSPEVHYIDSVLNSSPEVHYIVSVLNSSPEVHYIDSVLNSSPEVHYIDSVLNSSPEVHYIDSVLNSSPEVHYIVSVLNSSPEVHYIDSVLNSSPEVHYIVSVLNSSPEVHYIDSVLNSSPEVHYIDSVLNSSPEVHYIDSVLNSSPEVHYIDSVLNSSPEVHYIDSVLNSSPEVHYIDSVLNSSPEVHYIDSVLNLSPEVHYIVSVLNSSPEVHYIDSVLNSSPDVHYIVSVLNSSPEVHYIDSVLNSSPEVHYIDSVLNSSPEVHYIDSVLNSSPEVHYIDSVLNSSPEVHYIDSVLNSSPEVHYIDSVLNSSPEVHYIDSVLNSSPEVHYIDSVLNSSPEVHYIDSVLNSSPEVHYIDSVLNSSPEVHYIVSVLNSSPEVHYIVSVLNSSPEVHYIDSVLNSSPEVHYIDSVLNSSPEVIYEVICNFSGYSGTVRDMYRGGRGGSRWGGREGDSGGYGRRRNGRGGGWHNFSSDGASDGKGHPPELKGRQIGMWYAKRSQANKKSKERAERPVVSIGGAQEEHIQRLLHDIRSSEECPPQPERSGASLTDSEEEDWYENSDQSGPPGDKIKQKLSENSCSSSSRCFLDQNVSWQSTQHPSEEKRPVTARSHIEQLSASSSDGLTVDGEDGEQKEDSVTAEGVPRLTEIFNFIKEETDFMTKMEVEEEEKLANKLREDSALDKLLMDELIQKEVDPKYQQMQIIRRSLPSYKMKDGILDVIRNNQCVVISGETGCGKTTQVPQFILDDHIQRGLGSHCRVLCTQPRRISAFSVSQVLLSKYVLTERAEVCCISSGYMIKLSRPQGSILFCTTGILLKFLESDPLLERASHIILDEIHERDLQSDFLMIILKDLLPKRPELKLILMSATLNADSFSKYFYKCPMLNITGFTFPVKEYLLEDVVEMLKYQSAHHTRKKSLAVWKKKSRKHRDELNQIEEEQWMFDAWLRDLKGNFSPATIEALRNMDPDVIDLDLVKALIRYIVLKKGDGAILVFLPGLEEISRLCKMLLAETMFNSGKFMIIPLHSLMPTLNQKQVFERPPSGVRKIVIATSIAETSITIDDVVFVIDCGKIKVKDFRPENNLTTLEPQWVSKANAKQRRGRAGRDSVLTLGEGQCAYSVGGIVCLLLGRDNVLTLWEGQCAYSLGETMCLLSGKDSVLTLWEGQCAYSWGGTVLSLWDGQCLLCGWDSMLTLW
ncbi:hypothetical protein ACJMK2_007124 [Sinanodonta woodiana]|uniref:RNA helicase n=1 Tax=Sinanodonta woodiana TaxID=1069815 RepID=A0ABD3VJ09_SINWO